MRYSSGNNKTFLVSLFYENASFSTTCLTVNICLYTVSRNYKINVQNFDSFKDEFLNNKCTRLTRTNYTQNSYYHFRCFYNTLILIYYSGCLHNRVNNEKWFYQLHFFLSIIPEKVI